jgi:uncharacterized protein with ACT and thioredoxin-like domain
VNSTVFFFCSDAAGVSAVATGQIGQAGRFNTRGKSPAIDGHHRVPSWAFQAEQAHVKQTGVKLRNNR